MNNSKLSAMKEQTPDRVTAIMFDAGCFAQASALVSKLQYSAVTYGVSYFTSLAARLEKASGSVLTVFDDVVPNPDSVRLEKQATRIRSLPKRPEVFGLIDCGSAIDIGEAKTWPI